MTAVTLKSPFVLRSVTPPLDALNGKTVRGVRRIGKRIVLEFDDDFTYNKGPKSGALVEANYGKGRWLYVGLGLWRQLPAGTDGAYQILANLISLGRRAASR